MNDFWTAEAALSSKSEDWATPLDFFGPLHAEFLFTLDACAAPWNAKCPAYFSKADDGLSKRWAPNRVFLNPPYGKDIGRWLVKARQEQRGGALVVALLPARTDTAWWHDCVEGKAEVRFVRGRIRFVQQDGKNDAAPFPSAIAIYRPECAA